LARNTRTRRPADHSALSPEELAWRCDPDQVPTVDGPIEDAGTLIGQSRALDALRLGFTIESPGHNIFVCGPSGTGKMSTVRALLKRRPLRNRPLFDYAYVHNFSDPDRPRLLRMPAGTSRKFRKEFEKIVVDLPETLYRLLEADTLERKREKAAESYKSLERGLIGEFERTCDKHQFQLAQVQVGETQHLEIYPVHRKKPIDIEELKELVATGKARVNNLDELQASHDKLKAELRTILGNLRKEARHMQEEIKELESSSVRAALDDAFNDLLDQFPFDGARPWLEEVTGAILENLDLFDEDGDDEEDGGRAEESNRVEELLRRLRMNIVLDNDGTEPTPVVFENFPTFTNLLGTVERSSEDTRGTVDFTHIKAGSLLRADGGFLIVNANDAVQEPGVWRALYRVLKTRELEIQSPEQFMSPGAACALKPESIRVDVKVIAVGDDDLYRLLYTGTDEFRRVFKIKADFDDEMPRDGEHLALYAQHARRVVREEGLVPLGGTGLARLIEFGVRLADRQDRLSARFSDITDLLRESSHYARVAGAVELGGEHVRHALDERRRRHGLAEEKLHELVHSGVIDIATDGADIGQINALTVLDLADHTFGQPCRVTASVAPGNEGLISIEREVELSGRLHDKGTLILSGWLRSRYLPMQTMSLTATLTFEQLHDDIDGDSASAAEALALMSSLAEVPIPQGMAITGAIDQRGRILAIGGVNEKIEGFFRLCKFRGLTGQQGILIPADNRRNLQLDDEVVEAVREGRFHIWAISSLDEALERLTGTPAGALDAQGRFPPNSFNARVRERLIELARLGAERPSSPTRRGAGRARRPSPLADSES
jgi:predicted ATP-dependent protease